MKQMDKSGAWQYKAPSKTKGLVACWWKRPKTKQNPAGFELLWMNARKGASGFYLKMGYQIEGSEFEVPIFGPHYVMKKQLL